MPQISEKDYREYIYLKKKDEIRQQEIKKMMQKRDINTVIGERQLGRI